MWAVVFSTLQGKTLSAVWKTLTVDISHTTFHQTSSAVFPYDTRRNKKARGAWTPRALRQRNGSRQRTPQPAPCLTQPLIEKIAVFLHECRQIERMLAREALSQLGVALLERLDNAQMVDDRPRGAIAL